MNESLRQLPDDINAETLVGYFPEKTFLLTVGSTHHRGVYHDIAGFETVEMPEGEQVSLVMGRNSLYHALPEFMFHPIDRFDNIPEKDKKERFDEELEKQEKEKEHARRFFAPVDAMLLQLRMEAFQSVRQQTEGDKVLVDILCDRLPKEVRDNRFVVQLMPFMPHCKYIRGNRMFLTLMLRKVFMDEGLNVLVEEKNTWLADATPVYEDGVGGSIGESFAGNVYEEPIITYSLTFWSEEESQKDTFFQFLDEVEVMRQFLQDYFLSLEHLLVFDISTDGPPLRLADDLVLNYINYNANL